MKTKLILLTAVLAVFAANGAAGGDFNANYDNALKANPAGAAFMNEQFARKDNPFTVKQIFASIASGYVTPQEGNKEINAYVGEYHRIVDQYPVLGKYIAQQNAKKQPLDITVRDGLDMSASNKALGKTDSTSISRAQSALKQALTKAFELTK